MAALREGALLFSLKMLDQERAREAALSASRRTEAEMAARVEAEHRARLAQASLLRAVEARHRAEDAARREEAARREAVHTAALEQARMEAEQQARIAILSQEHERKLSALLAEEHGRFRRRVLVGGAALSMAIAAVAIAAYLTRVTRLEEELSRARRAQEAATEELRRARGSGR